MRDWPSHKCRTCKNFSYHRQLQGTIDIYKVSSCKINLRKINLHVDNAFCINLSRDQLWQNQSRWDQLASMGIQVNGLPVRVFVELNFVFDEYSVPVKWALYIYISMLLQLDHIPFNLELDGRICYNASRRKSSALPGVHLHEDLRWKGGINILEMPGSQECLSCCLGDRELRLNNPLNTTYRLMEGGLY